MKRTLDHVLGLFRKPSRELEQTVQERVAQRLGLDTDDVVHEIHQPARARKWQWPAVAAIAAAITLAVFLPIRIAQSAPAVLEDANGSRKIHFGEVVRPIGDKNATLAMADGSRVEVRSNSELSLERAEDGGTRIRLSQGALTVLAAVTGEVRVQQGATETRVRAGEQVTSSPTPVSPQKEPRVAFEVVSIRPSGPAVPMPGGRGGGQGLNSRPSPEGCVFTTFGYSTQLDPRRFAVTRATVMHLLSYTIPPPLAPAAFDQPSCGSLTGMGLLSGGPDWVKTDAWDLEAAIPEGTFTRKPTLTNPVLLQMIRTMLEERFKLVLRRETRVIPVYLLKVGKDGPKFNGQIPLTSDRWGGIKIERLDPDDKPVPAADLPPPPDGSITTFSGRCAAVQTCGQLSGRNVSMTNLATYLYGIDGRPVLDRTGLAGRYDFHYVDPGVQEAFARIISMRILEGYGGFGAPGTVLNRAALKALGLELEEGTAPFDAWVIDRAEKPSEN